VYPAGTVRSAVFAAGTTTLSTDYRRFTAIDDSITLVDKSAGADEERSFIAILSDGAMNASVLHDGGTVLYGAFAKGLSGTLVYGPSGTADGKMKITRPAVIESSRLALAYDDLSIWEVSWKPTATGTYATWSSGA
jgi:hypothetical protein